MPTLERDRDRETERDRERWEEESEERGEVEGCANTCDVAVPLTQPGPSVEEAY